MGPFIPPSPRATPASLPTPSVHPALTRSPLHPRADATTTSTTTSASSASTTASTSTTSANDPETDQPNNSVNLSTSSVVAIGLGFIAVALVAVTLLISYRAVKIARRAHVLRRGGDTGVTFRQLWRADGGMWGMISPGSHAMAGGMGGHGHWGGTDMVRMRRIEAFWAANARAGEGEWDKAEKPALWEVDIGGRGGGAKAAGGGERGWEEEGDENGDLERVEPLAVIPSPRPDPDLEQNEVDLLADPFLSISILIRLPTQDVRSSPDPPPGKNDEEEADEEPRDLIIGTMALIPVVPPGARLSGTGPSSNSTESLAKNGLEEKAAAAPLGYADSLDGGERRARWVTGHGGRWAVEDLE